MFVVSAAEYALLIFLTAWFLLFHVVDIAEVILAVVATLLRELRERASRFRVTWQKIREELKLWREL
jgi:hypothetical protein